MHAAVTVDGGRRQGKNQAALAAAYNPLSHLQQSPGVSADELWAMGMKRLSPELLKIQCKRAPGRTCRPPVVPEEKEGKMRAQPGAWEVQLNVFKGLKTT